MKNYVIFDREKQTLYSSSQEYQHIIKEIRRDYETTNLAINEVIFTSVLCVTAGEDDLLVLKLKYKEIQFIEFNNFKSWLVETFG